MDAILFDILFVGAGAIVGGFVGWYLRAGTKHGTISQYDSDFDPTHRPILSANEINDVMSRLQSLTANVADNVDEHNTRVAEFNTELTSMREQPRQVVDVVAKIINANTEMQAKLKDSERKLNEQAQQIEVHVTEARTDALTRLNNRRVFDDEMRKCHEEFLSTGRQSCVMMFDIDHFKKFNDTYGHQAGDEVLRTVAKTLRRSVAAKEIVCRYGGEEFAVIFPGSDIKTAMLGAERSRMAIAAVKVDFDGSELGVTTSLGIAEFLPSESAVSLVGRADEALYASKKAGRNCGHWNDGTTNRKIACTVPPANEQRFAEPANGRLESQAVREARRKLLNSFSDQPNFQGDVERRLAEWKRGGNVISILLVRVDEFGRFEDLNGNDRRETVLGITAQFLKAAMRDMDHIAYFSDGMFGLTLPTAKLTDALAVGERIRRAIERGRMDQVGQSFRLSVSIGVTECSQTDDVDELFQRASDAMESATAEGGNRCVVLNAVRASESA